MQKGTSLTCLMDCCHSGEFLFGIMCYSIQLSCYYSIFIHILYITFIANEGTVLDLPYNFVADGEQTEMKPQKDFPFLKLLALRKALREAGVERLRDLRDDDKRERAVAALAGGDRSVEG